MAKNAQSEIEAFLLTPRAHGLRGDATIGRIETHASLVFLAGDRAYKLKKAVDLGFLDFTTLEKRRAACEREVFLNRRTAPEIYLGLMPVRRFGDRLQLGGKDGEVAEWLVEMRRFPAEGLFATLADEGRLTRRHIEALAANVAWFHRAAEIVREQGGAENLVRVVKGNDANLRDYVGTVFDGSDIGRLREASAAEIEAHRKLLDRRSASGFVRHCHGDLHLGNVTLIDDRPVIFDCIEFSDEIASIDILYDLAFLLMDIAFREKSAPSLQGFANRALNVYLDHVGEDEIGPAIDGLALMPLFIATRAAVRAKVTAIVADTEEKRERPRAYLRFALEALEPSKPCIVAAGGLSGTGKSTLARDLAPRFGGLGAIHLRSDIIRKRLFGVAPLDRLPESGYAPEVGVKVYGEMMRFARAGVCARLPVVLDAVFADPEERATAEKVAAALGVPFKGLWLDAPASILEARVAARTAEARDPSDADVEILRRQLRYDLGEMRWGKVDASREPAETLEQALKLFKIQPA